jgi:hypothetical protein
VNDRPTGSLDCSSKSNGGHNREFDSKIEEHPIPYPGDRIARRWSEERITIFRLLAAQYDYRIAITNRTALSAIADHRSTRSQRATLWILKR